MSYGAQWWLWGIPGAVIVVTLSLAWAAWMRRRQASAGVTAPHLLDSRSAGLALIRHGMWFIGLLLVVIAASQPRWGEQEVERIGRGANIALLIDCSRSMLADDLAPNRMEVARRKAMDLMEAAPGHRVALMPFAAVPLLRCPLTGDRNAVNTMLKDLSPDLFPAESGLQGTAIGRSVESTIDVLKDQGDRGRAIVILSDGSDSDQEAVDAAAERARSAGIPVYGLFLGDTARQPELIIDGKPQAMNAQRDTLDTLATRTDALSVSVSTDRSDVRIIGEHIENHVSLLEWDERSRVMAAQRYQYPLIPGILLLVFACLIPTRRWRAQP